MRCVLVASVLGAAEIAAPWRHDKVAYARYMASTLTWGTLTTTSTRSEGSTPGDAFGNPYSFADIDGMPYIYASGLDASMIDIFGTNGTGGRVTLSLSEASIQPTVRDCQIGTGLGDPENPPCARLVLSGEMTKVDAG